MNTFLGLATALFTTIGVYVSLHAMKRGVVRAVRSLQRPLASLGAAIGAWRLRAEKRKVRRRDGVNRLHAESLRELTSLVAPLHAEIASLRPGTNISPTEQDPAHASISIPRQFEALGVYPSVRT